MISFHSVVEFLELLRLVSICFELVEYPEMFRISRVISTVAIILLILLDFLYFLHIWPNSKKIICDEIYFNDTLASILKPRWSGSRGHAEVANFLFEQLNSLGFLAIREELFDQRKYTNILGILNVDATRFLMLTCHYDSKFLPTAPHYVGATDGAVSCAILLNIAKTLNAYLREEFSNRDDIGLVVSPE